MPWAFYDFGLVPVRFDEDGKAKMPGYRHYLTWTPSKYVQWLADSMVDNGWDLPADIDFGEQHSCGSMNTPSVPKIRSLAATLNGLVSYVQTNPLLTPVQSISHTNAISAIARLFECLFRFARNYPGPTPGLIPQAVPAQIMSDVLFTREKIRPRAMIIPECLSLMLQDVSVAFHILCRSLERHGFRFICEEGVREWSCSAFSFVESTTSGKNLRLRNPNKALIRSGLLHHPSTEAFGTIEQNGMRNLAYYLLTPCPRHQLSVMTLCDHYPAGDGGALSRSSAAPLIDQAAHTEACNEIAAAILWPWMK